MGKGNVGLAAVVLVAAALLAGGLHASPAAAATVPSVPRSVAATAGPGSVRVTWQKPASNGGAAIDRYRIVRTSPGLPTRTHAAGAAQRALTITGLRPGTRYTFKVQAHNARGWSALSTGRVARPLALAGFGTIRTTSPATCGAIPPRFASSSPSLLADRSIDFGTNPYDDPADRSQLTPGGQEVLLDGNLGGSSLDSEVFAFEVLARCERASLVKTEAEIVYDDPSGKVDLLVAIDGTRIGVSVVRAVAFPFESPYPPEAATTLLDQKLDDLHEATADVNTADAWTEEVLVVFAYGQQHADTIETAWAGLDAATRGTSVVYVVVSDGDDQFIYSN